MKNKINKNYQKKEMCLLSHHPIEDQEKVLEKDQEMILVKDKEMVL